MQPNLGQAPGISPNLQNAFPSLLLSLSALWPAHAVSVSWFCKLGLKTFLAGVKNQIGPPEKNEEAPKIRTPVLARPQKGPSAEGPTSTPTPSPLEASGAPRWSPGRRRLRSEAPEIFGAWGGARFKRRLNERAGSGRCMNTRIPSPPQKKRKEKTDPLPPSKKKK